MKTAQSNIVKADDLGADSMKYEQGFSLTTGT